MRERRLDDPARADRDRPDGKREQDRAEDEGERREPPRRRHPPCADSGVRNRLRPSRRAAFSGFPVALGEARETLRTQAVVRKLANLGERLAVEHDRLAPAARLPLRAAEFLAAKRALFDAERRLARVLLDHHPVTSPGLPMS